MSANRQRREPWRNAERHYCAMCNAWMGSDRQSIMLHENGKKHIENQEKNMQQKRKEKSQEEQSQKLLLSSLQKMEQAALQSHLQQDTFATSSAQAPSFVPSIYAPPPVPSHGHFPPNSQQARPPPPPPPPPKQTSKEEKDKWLTRRKRREGDAEKDDSEIEHKTFKRRKIEPGEGHYEYDGKTYLEGPIFSELLEEEMPVQIWTGSLMANLEEKKLPERDMYWKNALIVAVRQDKAHVAYLASPHDTEETVEKNVTVDRIRIILGADDSIPDTLEEARLMAMGGEEIKVEPSESATLDEATGLTGWSTVAIKRTTLRQEVKEERGRLREKRKRDIAEKVSKEKEAEARKMEEAKVANADDSALGAYDVWGKGGYKGVDISNTGDSNLTVADTAKSLSTGKTAIAFKKKKKKPMANRSQRTTSADDD